MARYTKSKNKLARKIGVDLGLKVNSLKVARRLMVRPGQHGMRGRRKLSDFGTQLKEKQKMKYIYGILEKQLRSLYLEANKGVTSTGETLLSLLERRLDNAVYRAGWAPTRNAARQLVSHGHLKVNNRRMNVPSYRAQVNDVLSLSSTAMKMPTISTLLEANVKANVEWIERKGAVAKISRLPIRDDIQETIDEQLVVEYYSR